VDNFDLREFRQVPLPREEEVVAHWQSRDHHPKVSVICNTYNHRGLIEDALRGFLLQKTDFPFEVIVHDDASTDGTSEIVGGYASRYPRLIQHVLQVENQFSQGRKPTPISSGYALGDYLAFCEGDDFWVDSRKLQAQFDFLESNTSFSASSTLSFVLQGEVVGRARASSQTIVTHEEILLGLKEHCRMGSLMVRRAALPPTWPGEMNLANAGDNFIRVIATEYGPIGVLPRFYSCYRIHVGGVWSQLEATARRRKMLHDLYLLRGLVRPGLRAYVDCRIALTEVVVSRGRPARILARHVGTLCRHPLVSFRLVLGLGRRLAAKIWSKPAIGAGMLTGAGRWP
jgi:glycosyltransferase involved in cell wall biosynthesis